MIRLIALIMGIFSSVGRGVNNSRSGSYGAKMIKQFQEQPEKTKEVISKLTHRAWYVNLEQIPDWSTRKYKIPETFKLANGCGSCLYREFVGNNEVLLVARCNASEMGMSALGSVSAVDVNYTFVFHVRPNEKTGYHEIRTSPYNDTAEKNVMSGFGRKFFEAVKEL